MANEWVASQRITRDNMVHMLKTISPYYEAVASGEKTFEIRKNDRGFRVGDALILRHWDDVRQMYTGYEINVTVIYILQDERFLPQGYCCMAIV